MTRTLKTAAAAAALAVALPATAQAATVTVTGDDGQPRALSTTATTTIRNMDVEAVTTIADGEAEQFSTQVLGPDGTPASTASPCWSTLNQSDNFAQYRGNGTYRVVVRFYAGDDEECATPVRTLVYPYTIAAGVAIAQPPKWLITRPPNELSPVQHAFPFAQNPGATIYEIRFAREGTIGADGAIAGPSQAGYLDRTTSTVPIRFDKPGDWVIVARAKTDDFYTPWSRPVNVRVKAPFDLERVTFPDARGPSYKLKGRVRDRRAAGKRRVKVKLARGRKGGKFRTLGKAKVRRNGTFKLRFRVRRTGRYRLRYTYRGSRLMAGGKITQGVRIRRRLL